MSSKKTKKKTKKKIIKKSRMILIFCIFSVIFSCLIGRLYYLMIIKANSLNSKASNQWMNDEKIAPKRGTIVDRNRSELAESVQVYRVDLDLITLSDSLKSNDLNMKDISPIIAEILNMSEDAVYKKLTINSKYAVLKRKIEKEQADAIKSLNKEKELRGIIVSSDLKRIYPNNNFLAHVLGHTDSDGNGSLGVELKYNNYLSGIPGLKISESDAQRMDMPYVLSNYTKPIDGKDVVLTIDEAIQYFAEQAAEQALIDNNAKAVTVVVSNPNNGEILAMVNKPDYNPNKPWDNDKSVEENQKLWRNRAVSDTFEAGSILKVITVAAALSENVAGEYEIFHCPGYIRVGNIYLHCADNKDHGDQTPADILKNSCNVGSILLGQRLGAEKLNKYIKLFGFGEKTGVDLNGEAAGIIKNTEDITIYDLATISFGQTNTLSNVQFIRALNAIANGGKLITPHVMKEITHFDDEKNLIVDKNYDNYNEKQIIDPEMSRKLRGYLEKEVSEGGGKNAYIPGFHIGGKTGTANKIDTINGGYSDKHIVSFVAMAPCDNPQITMMITIDEPNPPDGQFYYAGYTAAPVAKRLFNDIFNYLSLKNDKTGKEISELLHEAKVLSETQESKETQDSKKEE